MRFTKSEMFWELKSSLMLLSVSSVVCIDLSIDKRNGETANKFRKTYRQCARGNYKGLIIIIIIIHLI